MTDEIQKAPDKELKLGKADLQQVVDFYEGRLPRHRLSTPLEAYCDKMDFTAELIQQYASRLQVVPILQETYGISAPTARMLFERTQMIKGKTVAHSMPFHLDVLLGRVMKQMNDAETDRDHRSAVAASKLYYEIINTHMGNMEAERYETFEMQPIIIGHFPEKFKRSLPENWEEQLEKLKQLKRSKEFGQKVAETISYEEVK